MGLSSLDAALTGLRAAQNQISVISNNVSNVNTAGFTRKIMAQNSQSINGVTVGVTTGTIMRNVDLNLERDLWTQVSSVGALDVKQSYLSRIEKFHGAPEDELSVAAEISRLRDGFSSLSDSPEDTFLQAQTVNAALKTANKINALGDLIMTSRNDAQSDITSSVSRVNQLLEQIADLNDKVQDNLTIGRSTAASEDKRDEAIKELAGLIDISFFKRGDGVLVVQTRQGVELANTQAKKLIFEAKPLGATSSYPDSAASLYVVDKQFTGDPATSRQAINVTQTNLGGRIGGLFELRDVDFPRQLAQLDEMAHKLALRFEAQGLKLFTDESGSIPADDPPDPNAGPPALSVAYVGFSLNIQVNEAIRQDNSLLQQGTFGASNIQTGSNEIIRRVIEFSFGSVNYQEAANANLATQVDLTNTGGVDLQTWLGLNSSNSFNGSRDLTPFLDAATLVASAAPGLDDPNDQFTITFDDPRLVPAPAPFTVTIDMSTLAHTGTNLAEDLRNEINAQLAGADPRFNASASVGTNGEIRIDARSNFTTDASGVNGMGAAGLSFLGMGESTYTTKDPYFDIKVGNQNPVRITLEPGDNAAALLTKLQAIENLAAQIDVDGNLILRPGDDDTFTSQSFGGDIQIIGGPFSTSGATYADTAAAGTRASIDNGVNISSALFGSYSINAGVINNNSAVTSHYYGSQISATNTAMTAFRTGLLGPGANISTNIIGSDRLIDFSQKMVNQHASDINSLNSALADEESLRQILQTQLSDESGVNLDEELSNLIVFQTAFAAAARVVNAVDEMFQELLNAF